MGDVDPAVPELLWHTADPHEVPLVMPLWARQVPEFAEALERGYEIRRAAGLPVDRQPISPTPALDFVPEAWLRAITQALETSVVRRMAEGMERGDYPFGDGGAR